MAERLLDCLEEAPITKHRMVSIGENLKEVWNTDTFESTLRERMAAFVTRVRNHAAS